MDKIPNYCGNYRWILFPVAETGFTMSPSSTLNYGIVPLGFLILLRIWEEDINRMKTNVSIEIIFIFQTEKLVFQKLILGQKDS